MRLYLDIDGVLTAAPNSAPVEISRDFVESPDGHTYILDWNIEQARRLFDEFEVVWATSWLLGDIEDIEAVEYYLDRGAVGSVPLTLSNYQMSRYSCGKLSAVRQHWDADPQPFVWLDDHMGMNDQAWARESGGIMFAPLYETGGIYPHIEEVLKYA